MKKVCTRCHIEKDRDSFSNCTRLKDGKNIYCRECDKKYRDQKGYEAKRRADPAYKQYNDQRNRLYVRTTKGRANYLLIGAKKRAVEKGLEFNLTVEYIEYFLKLGFCPRTGFQFDLETKGRKSRNMFAPSVDRIDNSKGYTTDNVQIVCDMYNHGRVNIPISNLLNFAIGLL